jgi:ABC-type Fe3+ transport system substrate-binding protein
VLADVVDCTSISLALKKENLLLKWLPDNAARFGKQFVDPEGYWVATNQYVLTPGFNTNLVPKGGEPKTFEDLLDPKWKGKMAWASIPVPSSAPGFIGLTLKRLGDEKGVAYLRELSRQNITDVGFAAGRPLLDQVIAGEYPVALQIFNNHAVISAGLGAPAAWIPMQPVMSNFSVVSVTRGGPNPNAGKLFVDFLVSTEGQQIYRSADYIPLDPEVPARHAGLRPDGDKLKAIYFTPEEIETSMPRWVDLYRQLFK